MRKLSMLAASVVLLVVGALALQPAEAGACTYEDWGQVSGGHYDCLGVACDPGWCCKICPVPQ